MGRSTRIEIPKTIYHVISRGNNKNEIFLDDKDYNVFLNQLWEVKKEKDFLLYCYCIMPNHFHLLLETIEIPLSKIMQQLLTNYAVYFNSRYDKMGHVFQDRYKAKICNKEEYLFKLVQYIHLNPVKAKITQNINKYKWSSHLCYAEKTENKNLSIEKLFSRMDCPSLRSGYRAYDSLIKEFNADDLQEISTNDFNKMPLQSILEDISSKMKIDKDIIISKNKNREANKARKAFAKIALKNQGYSLKAVADFLNRDMSVVSKYAKLQV